MCFPKFNADVSPKYNKEDGSVNDKSSNQSVVIPDMLEHIDSLFLNFDMNSDDGNLALVYEAGNEFFIVYTSDEAMELCNEPFSEFSPVLFY